ncbi:hypothetical protein L0156_12050 [bacterium]|nr:hypothetical protein [bacterium]
MAGAKKIKIQTRYHIGEWYGKTFSHLSLREKQYYARIQSTAEADDRPCPFKYPPGQLCTKAGGVCSIRLYQKIGEKVTIAAADDGMIRATCPYRFHQGNKIVSWIGEALLSTSVPKVVKEIRFLRALPTIGQKGAEVSEVGEPLTEELEKEEPEKEKDIGRIDMILVHPALKQPLQWCAVEIQAVYFSGKAFRREFPAIAAHTPPPDIPWALHGRRPDYRSSGPKRLLPQLQTKARDIRRWGKRLAVVVDRGFFNALAQMRFQKDISNADIAWFVVRFEETKSPIASIKLDGVFYTELEDAVTGLTMGKALTQAQFEANILAKLKTGKEIIPE